MKTYRFTINIQSAFGTPLVGDTLFGQLCWAVLHRFGEERLTKLLEDYTAQKPFAVVSDAMPQGYLPLPTLPSKFWQQDENADRKKLKKKQWITIEDSQQQVVSLWQQKEAVFIVSKAMKSKADFLANTFKNLHIKVVIEEVVDEYNFGEMEEQFLNLVSRYENENVAANVTGGTKLMSIALKNAFTLAEKPIFYIDTDQENRIIFITKDTNKAWLPNQPLNAINNVKTYLSAYGATVMAQGDIKINEKYLSAIEPFIKRYENYADLIPMLNNHASNSQQNGYKSTFDKAKGRPKTKEIEDLLLGLDYQNLIEYDGDTVNFKNRNIKEFLNGGWLEEYTYHQLKNIKNIEDILLNADVANFRYRTDKPDYANENKGNKNEFDIIFMAKNKLHIIECKTQLMNKNGGEKAEDILYKLETLKDYGGLFTKKCLVSYFEVSEAVKNRTKFLNIEIIQAKDLQRLSIKV